MKINCKRLRIWVKEELKLSSTFTDYILHTRISIEELMKYITLSLRFEEETGESLHVLGVGVGSVAAMQVLQHYKEFVKKPNFHNKFVIICL